MLYVIYAADQMYGGYHGMADWSIWNCNNEEEALEIARENSLDIIDLYPDIYKSIEEDIEEYIDETMSEEEVEELRSDFYNEDTEYNVWLIDEDIIKDYDIDNLERQLNDDPKDFIKKYCKEV